MDFRTDLAEERCRILSANAVSGVSERTYKHGSTVLHEVRIETDEASRRLGRDKGRYVTLEIEDYLSDAQLCDGRADALIEALRSMLPKSGSVLVAGLGNRMLTADSVGPLCADSIFVTRHIPPDMLSSLNIGRIRSVCCISPGVTGETGVDAAETVKSLCRDINAGAVIAVDALASRSAQRLCKSVQLCDSGIAPGSGVNNARKALSRKEIGVPVIGIGVPTVMSAAVLASEICGSGAREGAAEDLIVTPKDIDVTVKRASRLLALSINCALQSDISAGEMLMLM